MARSWRSPSANCPPQPGQLLPSSANLVRVDASVCEEHQNTVDLRPQRLQQLPRLLHRECNVGAAVHAGHAGHQCLKGRDVHIRRPLPGE